MNEIEWCRQKIKEAQEAADYQAWRDYQALLEVWEKRCEK